MKKIKIMENKIKNAGSGPSLLKNKGRKNA